ncbi:YoaK family protein [Spongiactinospora sp. TRM90649]|uniref:YoaK family protein n=1 Tax=Spongiactinospora sp. TRM90649 TaxID=3031114 RepID=UPI0023F948E9|nr:YoaK family protein [Spongiactinospora sp. TRM90649]MDF5757207.1 YoaK family protein [Spongiactinospora sp. TRM90649]
MASDGGGVPSPPVLIGLTFVSGMVDAATYLGIAQVFTSNMTGNLLIVGFAAAGTQPFSIIASLVSVVGFLVGAALGGQLTARVGDLRRRLIAGMSVEFAMNALTALESVLLPIAAPAARYPLIATLALSMGVRNAVIRPLKIPDIVTTTMTGTLTKLGADPFIPGPDRSRLGRCAAQIAALVAGACAAGLVLRHTGLTTTLVVMAAIVAALTATYILTSARP